MTAMPPTTGHLQLVEFASRIARNVTIIVSTQPDEPYASERYQAVRLAAFRLGLPDVIWHNEPIEQDPTTPGFREMWAEIYRGYGCGPGDYVVASETYGAWLAEMTGATFFPYDIDRTINPIKATMVRNDFRTLWDDIIPEFQQCLTTTVTIFGSESTGKTTLTRELGDVWCRHESKWVFEYARPYLENTSTEITIESMTAIWKGQRALQMQEFGVPVIVQDTDLFSTVGYWNIPHWADTLGCAPDALVADAIVLKSDLYIITRSDIPFEEDPLRYGGDHRETDDQYWIDLCKQHGLPYVVLKSSDLAGRIEEANALIDTLVATKVASLRYDRHGY